MRSFISILRGSKQSREAVFEENRVHERQRVQIVVQVITKAEGDGFVRPQICLGRFLDLSQSGAKLALPYPIAADRLWLRTTQGSMAEEIVECRVQWRDDDGHCGVKFERILDPSGFREAVGMNAARTPAPHQLKVIRGDEESSRTCAEPR